MDEWTWVQLSRELSGLDLSAVPEQHLGQVRIIALGRLSRMGIAQRGFPILRGSVDCILVPPKFAAQRHPAAAQSTAGCDKDTSPAVDSFDVGEEKFAARPAWKRFVALSKSETTSEEEKLKGYLRNTNGFDARLQERQILL